MRAVLAEIVARGCAVRCARRRGRGTVRPSDGQIVDPRVELRSAIDSLSFVSDAFPGFLEQLTARGPERRYYWMERSVERENVLVLSAELRNRGAASALGADIHFYASTQYNSMLTLIGVIPYADASLVFAVNHTFTNQVTGMGSSLRRSIARNLVASELARQLEETRKRLSR